MELSGTSRGRSQRAVSSRSGRPRSRDTVFSRLRRMGRSRDFDLARFVSALARAGRRRSELLPRLISDWVGKSFDEPQAERAWGRIVLLFKEMRKRLGPPLSLQTVLLHHFHSREGLLLQPRVVAGRDLDRLRLSAITDPLTGLYNRRFLSESLRRHLFRTTRSGQPLSVSMLDLESFKSINDRFGHPTGDRALICTADVIRGSLRPGDIASRWGGDEFLLMLPQADFLASVAIAERIRRRIAASVRSVRAGLTLDLYYGVASFPVDGRSAGKLLAVADDRLYQCREQREFDGGNRRRYPRFALERMRLRLLAGGRGVTAPVVNVGYGGLAFQARGESVPPKSDAEISQPDRKKPRPIRLRVAHAARLPGGRLRVGCKYS